MHSEKEKKLLLQLMDHLIKQNIDFFLDFKEPLSFQLEELFSELTSCDIEVDKKEEPAGISEL